MGNKKVTKQELREQLLFFNPEIIFAGTPGGLELLLCKQKQWIAVLNGKGDNLTIQRNHAVDLCCFYEMERNGIKQ